MRTLITGAYLYTCDEKWRVYPDGALLVEDGRIAWLGERAALPAGEQPAQRVLDVGGKVIIPGLVNAHAHGGLSLHRGICDSGGLFEWASSIGRYTSTLTDEAVELGCYLAAMEQIASGTTCTCDCTRYGAGLFARVATSLGLRSVSGALVNSPQYRPAGRPDWPAALVDTRRAQEELAGSGLARFFLGAHSTYNCTPELVLAVKNAARETELPFNIHVAETQEEVERIRARYGLTPVAWLDSLGVLDGDTIIDHAVWVDPAEIEILAARGVRVAHCPVSNAKLGSGIAPVPEMIQAGIKIGLGTDSVLSNNGQDIFGEMKSAVLLQRAARGRGDILSARDAIRMATLGGAQVLGWDDEIGSLAAGKRADLIALDLVHPLGLTPDRVASDLVYACGPQKVRLVMVNGEVIYEDGHYTRAGAAAGWERIRAFAESGEKS